MPALAELKNVVVQIAVSDTVDFLLRITGLFQCPGDLLQCRGIGEPFRAGTDTVKVTSDAGSTYSAYFHNMLKMCDHIFKASGGLVGEMFATEINADHAAHLCDFPNVIVAQATGMAA